MSRPKGKSPRLDIEITDEQLERAVRSNSGGCLIADAIKAQYPELTKVAVDMATIRVTDPKRGERYTYLTPADAQHVLLSFDQGWPIPTRHLTIRRAVHVGLAGRNNQGGTRREQQRARIAEAERAEAAGETLTTQQRRALAASRASRTGKKALQKATGIVPRPSSYGPRSVEIVDERVVVVGGQPPVTGAPHPNLLRGRNRHYGAQLADPGEAFRNAVDAAVAQRLTTTPNPTTQEPTS